MLCHSITVLFGDNGRIPNSLIVERLGNIYFSHFPLFFRFFSPSFGTEIVGEQTNVSFSEGGDKK